MIAPTLTAERLREVLHYDPDTGIWTRRIRQSQNTRVGEVAGWWTDKGYRKMRVDGRAYYSARLAFLYVTGRWPSSDVDHADRNPANDRWSNLREATASQNNANRKLPNKTGVRGVFEQKDRWHARITLGGSTEYLGSFCTRDQAADAYERATRVFFEEFAA